MIISEQTRAIAVALGKSHNMRVTAGVKFAEAWEYIKTPGTDGAKQLSDTGRPVTQAALWSLIVGDPSFPAELGLSWRAGQKLLAIGLSPDPEERAEKERAKKAEANAKRTSHKSQEDTKSPLHYANSESVKCNNPAPFSDNKCNSQFDEFMDGGGAQAPSATDDRIEAIIKFISPIMENDEMQEFGKLFEGICDPLSRAIRERAS